MAWAKKMGWRVHVWTVDDPAEAQRLLNLGVHAIITNQPKLIRDSLEVRLQTG
jgi:glycerophosphoryl diester phosphodiesterase